LVSTNNIRILMDLAFSYPQLTTPTQRQSPWDVCYVPAFAEGYNTVRQLAPTWDGHDLEQLRDLLPTETLDFDAIDDSDQTAYGSLSNSHIKVPCFGPGVIQTNSTGYKMLTSKGFGPNFAIRNADRYHAIVRELDAARKLWEELTQCGTLAQRTELALMCGIDLALLKEANFQKAISNITDINEHSVGGGERLVEAAPELIVEAAPAEPIEAQLSWSSGYTKTIIKAGGIRPTIINAEIAQARLIGGLLINLLNRDGEIMGVVEPCRSAVVSWFLMVGPSGCGKTPILDSIKPVRDAVEAVTDARKLHTGYLKAVARQNKAKKPGQDRVVVDDEFGINAPCHFFNDTSTAGYDLTVANQTYWRKPVDADLAEIIKTVGPMPNYGFCMLSAETSGLFGSLNMFNQSKDAALAKLLAQWTNCEGGIALRKKYHTTLSEPNSGLSILGGIQPAKFAPLCVADNVQAGGLGLTARFTILPIANNRSARDRDTTMPARIKIDKELMQAISIVGQTVDRWVCQCSQPLIDAIDQWIEGLYKSKRIQDKVLKYHENLIRSALAFECNEMLNRAYKGKRPILFNEDGDGVIGEVAIERAFALMKLSHETHLRMVNLGEEQALQADLSKAERAILIKGRMQDGPTYAKRDIRLDLATAGVPFFSIGGALGHIDSAVVGAAERLGKVEELLEEVRLVCLDYGIVD
jgi:Protein of unknown function (DUF3987)